MPADPALSHLSLPPSGRAGTLLQRRRRTPPEAESDGGLPPAGHAEGEVPVLAYGPNVAVLAETQALLAESPTGRALLAYAAAEGVTIDLDSQMEALGTFDPEAKVVTLNPTAPQAELAATLAHELRHVWQFGHDLWTATDLHPRDVLVLNRMMEADAEATSMLVNVELAERGHPETLETYAASSYGDQVEGWRHARATHPERDLEGIRAVFDQWFAVEERRGPYDLESVGRIEQELFAHASSAAKGFRTMSDAWLRQLGDLPDGRNYLRGTNPMPLSDPYYREGFTPEVENRLAHMERRFAASRAAPKARPQRAGGGP